MQKHNYVLSVLVCSILSVTALAEEVGQQPTNTSNTKTYSFKATRGHAITLDELASIADVSSARDEPGNPVVLSGKDYTVATYTRTTISILPTTGDQNGIITLDLLNK